MTIDSPVMFPAPRYRPKPMGRAITLVELCKTAGIPMAVSSATPPNIRLHDEASDFKAVSPGVVFYCLGTPGLPDDPRERASLILQKLAYQFHDWAAREVLSAYNRAQRRIVEDTPAFNSPARSLTSINKCGDKSQNS